MSDHVCNATGREFVFNSTRVLLIDNGYDACVDDPVAGSEYECEGTVLDHSSIEEHVLQVEWDNGCVNEYQAEDLDIVGHLAVLPSMNADNPNKMFRLKKRGDACDEREATLGENIYFKLYDENAPNPEVEEDHAQHLTVGNAADFFPSVASRGFVLPLPGGGVAIKYAHEEQGTTEEEAAVADAVVDEAGVATATALKALEKKTAVIIEATSSDIIAPKGKISNAWSKIKKLNKEGWI